MKKILVTGATRGIGRAITEKLLSEGHTIYGVYKDSTQQAGELVKKYGDKFALFWGVVRVINTGHKTRSATSQESRTSINLPCTQ